MAERNRVQPDGSIVAVMQRGAWMGNRGQLHEGHSIVRPWNLRAWIVCRLSFRDRRVAQWAPGHYTPLFFYDEAVAFAAGHRPCGECRRADYLFYREAGGAKNVQELDARLNLERRSSPSRAGWRGLPDGAFVLVDGGPALVLDDRVIAWDDAGYRYRAAGARPSSGQVDVLTPATTLRVLHAGFPIQIDEAAKPR